MAILIEVFRNVPAGKGCLALTKNVLDYVSDKQGEFEIKFISMPSEVAEERGITRAPSIVVNRKASALGVASVEEIEALIEQAKPVKMGIILTKSPFESEDATMALSFGINALNLGDSVDLFLLGDGVWTAKTDIQGEVSNKRDRFIENNGNIFVSAPHLKAGGIGREGIIGNTEICEKPYDTLVDLTMTKWEKVVSF